MREPKTFLQHYDKENICLGAASGQVGMYAETALSRQHAFAVVVGVPASSDDLGVEHVVPCAAGEEVWRHIEVTR